MIVLILNNKPHTTIPYLLTCINYREDLHRGYCKSSPHPKHTSTLGTMDQLKMLQKTKEIRQNRQLIIK